MENNKNIETNFNLSKEVAEYLEYPDKNKEITSVIVQLKRSITIPEGLSKQEILNLFDDKYNQDFHKIVHSLINYQNSDPSFKFKKLLPFHAVSLKPHPYLKNIIKDIIKDNKEEISSIFLDKPEEYR